MAKRWGRNTSTSTNLNCFISNKKWKIEEKGLFFFNTSTWRIHHTLPTLVFILGVWVLLTSITHHQTKLNWNFQMAIGYKRYVGYQLQTATPMDRRVKFGKSTMKRDSVYKTHTISQRRKQKKPLCIFKVHPYTTRCIFGSTQSCLRASQSAGPVSATAKHSVHRK